MRSYDLRTIKNCVTHAMSEGWSTNDALDLFLSMKMENDLVVENIHRSDSLSPSNIRMNLLGNGVIDDKDIKIEYCTNRFRTPRLIVALSQTCKLYGELVRGSLQITVNDKNMTAMTIRYMEAGDVALWMVRQKRYLDDYMEEWEKVLKESAKKTKSNRMAMLAIKAIFTQAMRQYPDLEYFFVEQKRRVRIRVKLPNSKLGVIIDGWWGSYKERLPQQIEELKALIEAHSKTSIKDFYISNR